MSKQPWHAPVEAGEFTPAQELRVAAQLMRLLADRATRERWQHTRAGNIDAGEYGTVIGAGQVDCMSHCYGGTSTIDGDNLDADLDHIAAMDPPVTKAVAECLRVIADDVGTSSLAFHAALGVARAFMRTETGEPDD